MAGERRGATAAKVLTDSCQVMRMSVVHQPLNLLHSERSWPGEMKLHSWCKMWAESSRWSWSLLGAQLQNRTRPAHLRDFFPPSFFELRKDQVNIIRGSQKDCGLCRCCVIHIKEKKYQRWFKDLRGVDLVASHQSKHCAFLARPDTQEPIHHKTR